MKKFQLFQRMIPFRLKTINDYADLSAYRQRIAVFKPIGVEVYITPDGNIFDFNGLEITNPSVRFKLSDIIDRVIKSQAMVFGFLTSEEDILPQSRWLYIPNNHHDFSDIMFEGYDMIFPLFSVNFQYKLRLDQVKSIFEKSPSFKLIDYEFVPNFMEFNKLIYDKFNPYKISGIYIFDTNKIYRQGLSYNKKLAPMYEILPSQRFRTHVKNIIPGIMFEGKGGGIRDRITVADMLIGKFKKELLEIPVVNESQVLRKSIWEKKNNLKGMPFWFSGFTVYYGEGIKIAGTKFHKFIL